MSIEWFGCGRCGTRSLAKECFVCGEPSESVKCWCVECCSIDYGAVHSHNGYVWKADAPARDGSALQEVI